MNNYSGLFLKSEFNKDICNLSNSIVFSKNSEIINMYKEQINKLDNKCKNLLKNSHLNFELNTIDISFRKSINKPYYLYLNSKGKYFSLISPNEWETKDKYLGCYKLNGDLSWVECCDEDNTIDNTKDNVN